ncbi:hypothetical protein GOP47_0029865 [Adiantum capillus-veneris]|nr:hypothetical protein GOP47_0029865 [Adiantum capillus-veneris]
MAKIKVIGGAPNKLFKIKVVRLSVAQVLTILSQNQKAALRTTYKNKWCHSVAANQTSGWFKDIEAEEERDLFPKVKICFEGLMRCYFVRKIVSDTSQERMAMVLLVDN